MRRPRRSTAAAIAASAVALAGCRSVPEPQPRAAPGARGPEFAVRLTTGEAFRLADHTDEVVVLTFFTTGCDPCIPALRNLDRLHRTYAGAGLYALAVSIDEAETAPQVAPFVRARGYAFATAHDEQSRITELYNKRALVPFVVVLGRGARIVSVRDGYLPGDDGAVEATVVEALGEPEPAPSP